MMDTVTELPLEASRLTAAEINSPPKKRDQAYIDQAIKNLFTPNTGCFPEDLLNLWPLRYERPKKKQKLIGPEVPQFGDDMEWLSPTDAMQVPSFGTDDSIEAARFSVGTLF